MKKKAVYTLFPILSLSAILLTGCGSREEVPPVTQKIAASDETVQSEKSAASVDVTQNEMNNSAQPAKGDSVAIQSQEGKPSSGAEASVFIGEEKAKQIALAHALVSDADISYMKVKLDTDDGKSEYEVEFYSGNKEYDYDIDAATGTILSIDYDIENKDFAGADMPDGLISEEEAGKAALSGAGASATQISESDARQIALQKVPGASDSDIRMKLDEEDGRLVYEGKIIYSDMEYEFEIDTTDGTVLKWEEESVFN